MRALTPFLFLVACGGQNKDTVTSHENVEQLGVISDQAEIAYPGPDAWTDWQSYTNVSPGPWVSKTHDSRFVQIYVNAVGRSAYKKQHREMPVGSVLVKASWENTGGVPGQKGPLFIMEKMPAGFAPENNNWFYAFRWPNPPPKWVKKIGTNVEWRSPSEKVAPCVTCHNRLERGLGLPPKDRRTKW